MSQALLQGCLVGPQAGFSGRYVRLITERCLYRPVVLSLSSLRCILQSFSKASAAAIIGFLLGLHARVPLMQTPGQEAEVYVFDCKLLQANLDISFS